MYRVCSALARSTCLNTLWASRSCSIMAAKTQRGVGRGAGAEFDPQHCESQAKRKTKKAKGTAEQQNGACAHENTEGPDPSNGGGEEAHQKGRGQTKLGKEDNTRSPTQGNLSSGHGISRVPKNHRAGSQGSRPAPVVSESIFPCCGSNPYF